MGSAVIVVRTPKLEKLPRVLQRQELIDIQTLVTQSTVEALDVSLLHGLTRVGEVELHAAHPGLGFQCF